VVWEGLTQVLRRAPTDSKKLTTLQRARGAAYLETVVAWSLGSSPAEDIDLFGIQAATTLAADRALLGLPTLPHSVVADAGLYHRQTIPTEWFIKGDERILQIMAASIIAKVHRDKIMTEYHAKHPQYDWASNKGYGTVAHSAAIRKYGAGHLHRHSFLDAMIKV
jgi:ribonuclease HII